MPVKVMVGVRRFFAFAFFLTAGFAFTASAQTSGYLPKQAEQNEKTTPFQKQDNTSETKPKQDTQPPVSAPMEARKPVSETASMHERIGKAKAFVALRNYTAAIFELENILRESTDPAVRSVVNVLLMGSYLEQGNYKKARELLTTSFNSYKTNNLSDGNLYPTVAGQVVKSARNQAERYRTLGLSPADQNLPREAVADIENMRATLEVVIEQSREAINENHRSSSVLPLLEEALAARSILGRDDFDSKRWLDAVADAREQLANSRSMVFNVVSSPATEQAAVTPPDLAVVRASNSAPSSVSGPAEMVAERTNEVNGVDAVKEESGKTSEIQIETPMPESATPQPIAPAKTSLPSAKKENTKIVSTEQSQSASDKKPSVQKPAEAAKTPSNGSIQPVNEKPAVKANDDEEVFFQAGPLLAYAIRQSQPVYPPRARQYRASGIVRVEVIVDENGDVADVKSMSGHALLQPAAQAAIMQWKFRPFIRDGKPVKAIGFINFNFSL